MTEVQTYARSLADQLLELEKIKETISDIVASAKDAGVNVKALRKVSREMVMNSDKREQLYEDEAQLEMFRSEVGLTSSYSVAAE